MNIYFGMNAIELGSFPTLLRQYDTTCYGYNAATRDKILSYTKEAAICFIIPM